MKIIITAKGKEWDSKVDPRFGRTEYFFIYDEESQSVDFYDNRSIKNEAHGAGTKTAQRLSEIGAKVLITGNGPGSNASVVLEKIGVDVYLIKEDVTVKEAYDAYKAGKLSKI